MYYAIHISYVCTVLYALCYTYFICMAVQRVSMAYRKEIGNTASHLLGMNQDEACTDMHTHGMAESVQCRCNVPTRISTQDTCVCVCVFTYMYVLVHGRQDATAGPGLVTAGGERAYTVAATQRCSSVAA